MSWLEIIDEMQKAPDALLATYDTKRPDQGRRMKGECRFGASSMA